MNGRRISKNGQGVHISASGKVLNGQWKDDMSSHVLSLNPYCIQANIKRLTALVVLCYRARASPTPASSASVPMDTGYCMLSIEN